MKLLTLVLSFSALQNRDNQPEEIYPDPEIERDIFVRQAPQSQVDLFGTMNGFGGSLEEQQRLLNMFQSMTRQPSHGQPAPLGAQAPPFSFAANPNPEDFGIGGANPFFANMTTENPNKVPDTWLQKFLKTKLHIVLMGLLTYAFITIGELKYSVFLVFLLWETAEIFILRQHQITPDPFFNIAFMFIGISPTKMNVVLKWWQLLNKVLRDVAIFLFAFTCSHLGHNLWYGLGAIPVEHSATVVTGTVNIDADSTDDFNALDF